MKNDKSGKERKTLVEGWIALRHAWSPCRWRGSEMLQRQGKYFLDPQTATHTHYPPILPSSHPTSRFMQTTTQTPQDQSPLHGRFLSMYFRVLSFQSNFLRVMRTYQCPHNLKQDRDCHHTLDAQHREAKKTKKTHTNHPRYWQFCQSMFLFNYNIISWERSTFAASKPLQRNLYKQIPSFLHKNQTTQDLENCKQLLTGGKLDQGSLKSLPTL